MTGVWTVWLPCLALLLARATVEARPTRHGISPTHPKKSIPFERPNSIPENIAKALRLKQDGKLDEAVGVLRQYLQNNGVGKEKHAFTKHMAVHVYQREMQMASIFWEILFTLLISSRQRLGGFST